MSVKITSPNREPSNMAPCDPSLPRCFLNRRQLCDLELILNGAFAPLSGYMGKQEVESVLDSFYMPDGAFFPMPVVLDVFDLRGIEAGKPLLLCDGDKTILASMEVGSIWEPNRMDYAGRLFQTTDTEHPGVYNALREMGPFFLSGRVRQIEAPRHYDFLNLRHTPTQLKARLAKGEMPKWVSFNTRNPMHRAHYELTVRAMERIDGSLLIHPVVGVTKPGDIDYVTRVKCYQSILKHYPSDRVLLSLIPLAMRMAGPREALWHGLIRKNYGCTHFIVGRDHASPGLNRQGKPFYGPYDAQILFKKFEKEIGLTMVPFQEICYSPARKKYVFLKEAPLGEEKTHSISGTQLREALANDAPVPDWFSYPEVLQCLRNSIRPKSRQGLTIFFTGLSGSGKSTVAKYLEGMLREKLLHKITFLDGDFVRQNLFKKLSFSKEDRDANVRWIGFVASEIVKHGGICICCLIAPYEAIRQENRRRILNMGGHYVEVYMKTPLAVCEARDPKGLYAKAREGCLKQLTGVDDTYEIPVSAELVIDGSDGSPLKAAEEIFSYLNQRGFLSSLPQEGSK